MSPFSHFGHDIVQDLQLAASEYQIERLPDADHDDQHQGEQDRGTGEGLDQPEHHEAAQLDEGEHVDSLDRYLSQEHVIGLILGRHEHDQQPIVELESLERRRTHVQKDAV